MIDYVPCEIVEYIDASSLSRSAVFVPSYDEAYPLIIQADKDDHVFSGLSFTYKLSYNGIYREWVVIQTSAVYQYELADGSLVPLPIYAFLLMEYKSDAYEYSQSSTYISSHTVSVGYYWRRPMDNQVVVGDPNYPPAYCFGRVPSALLPSDIEQPWDTPDFDHGTGIYLMYNTGSFLADRLLDFSTFWNYEVLGVPLYSILFGGGVVVYMAFAVVKFMLK